MGTVYRILNQLKEKGKVKEILTEVSHFDGDTSFHSHFICQKCKKIFDVFGELPDLKNKKLKVGKVKIIRLLFMESVNSVKNNLFCHDCQKRIEIEGKEIKNGKMLFYESRGEKITIFKCNDCFQKSQELKNFQSCEVYSRIVGYLRPIQQWNWGKQLEFKERKEYRIKESI